MESTPVTTNRLPLTEPISAPVPIVERSPEPAPQPSPQPSPQPEPDPPKPRKRRRIRRFFKRIAFLLVLVLVILQLVAFSFKVVTPPRTSYMLQDGEPIAYQYVSLNHISRYMIASMIAHEDQQLGPRVGAFDIESFKARAEAYMAGEPDPGGSTIPQQLAKNIYLWPQESAIRKG